MHRITAIAWKDLRSTMRDLPALALMLAAPLALAALLGLAFGGGETFDVAATKVAVVDLDRGARRAGGEEHQAGKTVSDLLTGPQLRDVLEPSVLGDRARARSAVDEGEVAVAVIIPEDFSTVAFGADPRARTSIELYQNPTREIGAAVTGAVLDQALIEFNGARAAAVAAVIAGGAGGQEVQATAGAAAEGFSQGGGVNGALRFTQRAPLRAGVENEVSVTGAILAGMMVFFMFFGASNVARTILEEERAGTLPRLLTTPAPQRVVLGGKLASVFVTVGVQGALLLLAGWLIFRIDWGRLDGVLLLTLAGAAVAGALALLVIGLVRTPAQAGAIGAGVYLVLALVGGNFTGGAQTSGTFAVVRHLTPNGWLLDGWDTVMRGGTAADILTPVLVSLAFAAVFFALAVWRLGRRYA
jgi:ABC-2 type transport system permease protein